MTDRSAGPGDGPWRLARAIVVLGADEGRGGTSRARLDRAVAGWPGIDVRFAGAGAPFPVPAELARVDLLVIAAGVEVDAASLAALREAAGKDPVIAMAVPRFDRDALTAFPPGGTSPCADPAGARALLRALWPAIAYAVLPDRRLLYVKGAILAEVPEAGALAATGAWDACALTLNRSGFRVAVANHAWARLPAGDPPAPALAERLGPLGVRFPGARRAVASHLASAPRRAEQLLGALLPGPDGRRTIGFEGTHLRASHSGTAELARALVARATTTWAAAFDVAVVARPDAFAFHFGDLARPPRRVEPEDPETFAAFVRIGQPFIWRDLEHAVRRAPALVFFMLDTIGFDCLALAPDDLDAVWRFTFAEADGMLFNSAFTERQFARRFAARPGLPRLASLHSLDVADYRAAGPNDDAGGRAILVIGNSFPHKRVEETARLLAGAGLDDAIVVLGLPGGRVPGIEAVPSGPLERRALSALFARARLVVYPSVYEGFGFPVVDALAHRRPVLVRPLPPYDELAQALPEAANIHTFADDDALLALVRGDLRWREAAVPRPRRGWDEAVADLREVLDRALAGVDYDRVVRRVDGVRGRAAWVERRHLDLVEGLGPADLDRAADLAGRTVERAVRGLVARLPGASAVLRALGRTLGRGR